MGGVTKVVAKFPAPFWRKQGLAGAGISHSGPITEFHDMSSDAVGGGCLLGFAASPGPTEQAVLKQLTQIFGRDMPPVKVTIQDWAAEPFTVPSGGGENDNYDLFGHEILREGASGRPSLVFIGTETSTEYAGHLEGALASAERVSAPPPRAAEEA